jgi:hypothetical protein
MGVVSVRSRNVKVKNLEIIILQWVTQLYSYCPGAHFQIWNSMYVADPHASVLGNTVPQLWGFHRGEYADCGHN